MSMTMMESDTRRGFIDVRDMGVTFGANGSQVVTGIKEKFAELRRMVR